MWKQKRSTNTVLKLSKKELVRKTSKTLSLSYWISYGRTKALRNSQRHNWIRCKRSMRIWTHFMSLMSIWKLLWINSKRFRMILRGKFRKSSKLSLCKRTIVSWTTQLKTWQRSMMKSSQSDPTHHSKIWKVTPMTHFQEMMTHLQQRVNNRNAQDLKRLMMQQTLH